MTRAPRNSSLWRHRDFLLLWGGQAVSEVGSAVTTLALPLTAVVVLRASTFQVGALSAATTAAFLFIAVPAGALVDRLPKRQLMAACDLARMLIIASVPAAAAAGALTLAQLYAVALLTGAGTVFFDVAYQSYVPSLIGREQLLDGNGKLQTTAEAARLTGPGLGGGLVALAGAAGAMVADAVSYAVSVASLLAIRAPEPVRAARPARARLRAELTAGLSFVLREPILRKIVACTATANLFASMGVALEIVYLVRVLHVPPAYTGLLVALAAAGGVAGGVASPWLSRRIGSARIIWVSSLAFGPAGLLVPLARPGWGVLLFAAGWFGFSFSAVLYNVAQLSYRQAICPPHLLGRMNAAVRWLVWGTLPLGGLLGGVLGSGLGVRATMLVAVTGTWAAGLWVLFSPLRRMRDVPPPGSYLATAGGRAGPRPAAAPEG